MMITRVGPAMMMCQRHGGKVSRFGVFWLPWLTTAASGSCRLKSAAAIDVEDVRVAHHADESSRLRSARIC